MNSERSVIIRFTNENGEVFDFRQSDKKHLFFYDEDTLFHVMENIETRHQLEDSRNPMKPSNLTKKMYVRSIMYGSSIIAKCIRESQSNQSGQLSQLSQKSNIICREVLKNGNLYTYTDGRTSFSSRILKQGVEVVDMSEEFRGRELKFFAYDFKDKRHLFSTSPFCETYLKDGRVIPLLFAFKDQLYVQLGNGEVIQLTKFKNPPSIIFIEVHYGNKRLSQQQIKQLKSKKPNGLKDLKDFVEEEDPNTISLAPIAKNQCYYGLGLIDQLDQVPFPDIVDYEMIIDIC